MSALDLSPENAPVVAPPPVAVEEPTEADERAFASLLDGEARRVALHTQADLLGGPQASPTPAPSRAIRESADTSLLREDLLKLFPKPKGKHWDPQRHPRWPAGTPGGLGGQFMHAGQRFLYKGVEYDIESVMPGKLWAHIATHGKEKEPKTVEFEFKETTAQAAGYSKAEMDKAELKPDDKVTVGVGAEHPPFPPMKVTQETAGHTAYSGTTKMTATALDPYVHPETHDSSIPIPPSSSLTEEQWQRFGKVDQERYCQLMELYGPYDTTGNEDAWKKVAALMKQVFASVSSDTLQQLQSLTHSQYGSSSGFTLSFYSLFVELQGKSADDPAVKKAWKDYEKLKGLQDEIGSVLQWDLYNRVRAPDIAVFHGTPDYDFFADEVQGKGVPIFAGLSQSQNFDVWSGWGSAFIATPLAIRHVMLASIAYNESSYSLKEKGHLVGEQEVATADALIVDHRSLVSHALAPELREWLLGVTQDGASGEIVELLIAHLADPHVKLPIPPAKPDLHMDSAKTYVEPPAGALEGIEKLEYAETDAKGAPVAHAAKDLDLQPGDYIEGMQGTRYIIVLDPSQTLGISYLKVCVGKPVPGTESQYEPTGQKTSAFSNFEVQEKGTVFHFEPPEGTNAFKKLKGHYVLPLQEEGSEEWHPEAWAHSPPSDKKMVADMQPGEKFMLGGATYEIVSPSTEHGKTKVKAVQSGELGTVNSAYETTYLTLKPGYTEKGLAGYQGLEPFFAPGPMTPLGEMDPQPGDHVLIGQSIYEVVFKTGEGKFQAKWMGMNKPLAAHQIKKIGKEVELAPTQKGKLLVKKPEVAQVDPNDFFAGPMADLSDVQVGDLIKMGVKVWQVGLIDKKGIHVIQASGPTGFGKENLLQPSQTGQKLTPKPLGWKPAQVGDMLSLDGEKATVTKVLKDGTVQVKKAKGGVVKFAPNDPALADLYRPADWMPGPKVKLKTLAVGDLVHGGTGKTIHPYRVVEFKGDKNQMVILKNLETGDEIPVSGGKSYVKLVPFMEPTVQVPEDHTTPVDAAAGFVPEAWEPWKPVPSTELKVGDKFLDAGKPYEVVQAPEAGAGQAKDLTTGEVKSFWTTAGIQVTLLQPKVGLVLGGLAVSSDVTPETYQKADWQAESGWTKVGSLKPGDLFQADSGNVYKVAPGKIMGNPTAMVIAKPAPGNQQAAVGKVIEYGGDNSVHKLTYVGAAPGTPLVTPGTLNLDDYDQGEATNAGQYKGQAGTLLASVTNMGAVYQVLPGTSKYGGLNVVVVKAGTAVNKPVGHPFGLATQAGVKLLTPKAAPSPSAVPTPEDVPHTPIPAPGVTHAPSMVPTPGDVWDNAVGAIPGDWTVSPTTVPYDSLQPGDVFKEGSSAPHVKLEGHQALNLSGMHSHSTSGWQGKNVHLIVPKLMAGAPGAAVEPDLTVDPKEFAAAHPDPIGKTATKNLMVGDVVSPNLTAAKALKGHGLWVVTGTKDVPGGTSTVTMHKLGKPDKEMMLGQSETKMSFYGKAIKPLAPPAPAGGMEWVPVGDVKPMADFKAGDHVIGSPSGSVWKITKVTPAGKVTAQMLSKGESDKGATEPGQTLTMSAGVAKGMKGTLATLGAKPAPPAAPLPGLYGINPDDWKGLEPGELPDGWELGDAIKATELKPGDVFRSWTGTADSGLQYVTAGQSAPCLYLGDGAFRNLVTGVEYKGGTGPSKALMGNTVKLVKNTQAGGKLPLGFDPAAWVGDGKQVHVGDLKPGTVFQAMNGAYFQVGEHDTANHVKLTNLVTGAADGCDTKMLAAQTMTHKSGTPVPYDQLVPGDKTTVGDLKVGDQLKLDITSHTVWVVQGTETSGDETKVTIGLLLTGGTTTTAPTTPVFLHAKSGTAGPAPVETITDWTALPKPDGYVSYKWHKSGTHTYPKLKALPEGTVFQDNAHHVYKVKSAGAHPVITDGEKLYQAEPDWRGLVLDPDSVYAKTFVDHSPTAVDSVPKMQAEQAKADMTKNDSFHAISELGLKVGDKVTFDWTKAGFQDFTDTYQITNLDTTNMVASLYGVSSGKTMAVSTGSVPSWYWVAPAQPSLFGEPGLPSVVPSKSVFQKNGTPIGDLAVGDFFTTTGKETIWQITAKTGTKVEGKVVGPPGTHVGLEITPLPYSWVPPYVAAGTLPAAPAGPPTPDKVAHEEPDWWVLKDKVPSGELKPGQAYTHGAQALNYIVVDHVDSDEHKVWGYLVDDGVESPLKSWMFTDVFPVVPKPGKEPPHYQKPAVTPTAGTGEAEKHAGEGAPAGVAPFKEADWEKATDFEKISGMPVGQHFFLLGPAVMQGYYKLDHFSPSKEYAEAVNLETGADVEIPSDFVAFKITPKAGTPEQPEGPVAPAGTLPEHSVLKPASVKINELPVGTLVCTGDYYGQVSKVIEQLPDGKTKLEIVKPKTGGGHAPNYYMTKGKTWTTWSADNTGLLLVGPVWKPGDIVKVTKTGNVTGKTAKIVEGGTDHVTVKYTDGKTAQVPTGWLTPIKVQYKTFDKLKMGTRPGKSLNVGDVIAGGYYGGGVQVVTEKNPDGSGTATAWGVDPAEAKSWHTATISPDQEYEFLASANALRGHVPKGEEPSPPGKVPGAVADTHQVEVGDYLQDMDGGLILQVTSKPSEESALPWATKTTVIKDDLGFSKGVGTEFKISMTPDGHSWQWAAAPTGPKPTAGVGKQIGKKADWADIEPGDFLKSGDTVIRVIAKPDQDHALAVCVKAGMGLSADDKDVHVGDTFTAGVGPDAHWQWSEPADMPKVPHTGAWLDALKPGDVLENGDASVVVKVNQVNADDVSVTVLKKPEGKTFADWGPVGGVHEVTLTGLGNPKGVPGGVGVGHSWKWGDPDQEPELPAVDKTPGVPVKSVGDLAVGDVIVYDKDGSAETSWLVSSEPDDEGYFEITALRLKHLPGGIEVGEKTSWSFYSDPAKHWTYGDPSLKDVLEEPDVPEPTPKPPKAPKLAGFTPDPDEWEIHSDEVDIATLPLGSIVTDDSEATGNEWYWEVVGDDQIKILWTSSGNYVGDVDPAEDYGPFYLVTPVKLGPPIPDAPDESELAGFDPDEWDVGEPVNVSALPAGSVVTDMGADSDPWYWKVDDPQTGKLSPLYPLPGSGGWSESDFDVGVLKLVTHKKQGKAKWTDGEPVTWTNMGFWYEGTTGGNDAGKTLVAITGTNDVGAEGEAWWIPSEWLKPLKMTSVDVLKPYSPKYHKSGSHPTPKIGTLTVGAHFHDKTGTEYEIVSSGGVDGLVHYVKVPPTDGPPVEYATDGDTRVVVVTISTLAEAALPLAA